MLLLAGLSLSTHMTETTQATNKLDRIVPLTFGNLLREFLSQGDNVKITADTAHTIETIDPEEEYIHVEWPNDINLYSSPVLWQKGAWLNHYQRYAALKELCGLESAVREAELSLMRRLLKQLNHFAPPFDKEMVNRHKDRAVMLVKQRSYGVIKFYSVNVDELIKADKILTEYKLKLKDKREGKKV